MTEKRTDPEMVPEGSVRFVLVILFLDVCVTAEEKLLWFRMWHRILHPGAVRRPAGGAALPGAPHPPVADLSLGDRAGAGRTVSPLFNSLQDAICKKEMSVWQKWKLWRSAARAAATA